MATTDSLAGVRPVRDPLARTTSALLPAGWLMPIAPGSRWRIETLTDGRQRVEISDEQLIEVLLELIVQADGDDAVWDTKPGRLVKLMVGPDRWAEAQEGASRFAAWQAAR